MRAPPFPQVTPARRHGSRHNSFVAATWGRHDDDYSFGNVIGLESSIQEMMCSEDGDEEFGDTESKLEANSTKFYRTDSDSIFAICLPNLGSQW